MKIDTHVDYGKDFGRQGVGHLGGKGAIGRTWKTAVDILSIGHFPTKEQESVDVDDWQGDDRSACDLLKNPEGNHAANHFDAIDFIPVKASAQQ
jgi:hypothetical protein